MTQALADIPRAAAKPAPPRHPDAMPPAVILGGGANALSVSRQLGRMGVRVYGLCDPGTFVRHSRYCTPLEVERSGADGERADGAADGEDAGVASAWAKFLLGPESDGFRGAVLLACSDAGIRLVAENRERLAARFLLDESDPRAQLAMLNKLSTYRAAAAAGVPTPKFWVAESARDLEAVRHELVFPLVVKPRLGYVFEARTGKKLLQVSNYDEVAAAVDAVAATGTGSVLMEKIPGNDDRLCSYYTYLDENSRPLFQFTKRVIRRYPVMTGAACYHVTDWIPEAAELGNRLFAHVGLRGLANVEFKRDDRDGKLKLIECNARFTASDCLVARSGVNLAAFAYCRITGRTPPAMDHFVRGMRLWDPVRDFQAHLSMKKAGAITTRQWIASVMRRQSFAYFQWTDPMPAVARLTAPVRRKIGLVRER
jgi:predicted ATP-grasp superfamily ATP-dependent carboligase